MSKHGPSQGAAWGRGQGLAGGPHSLHPHTRPRAQTDSVTCTAPRDRKRVLRFPLTEGEAGRPDTAKVTPLFGRSRARAGAQAAWLRGPCSDQGLRTSTRNLEGRRGSRKSLKDSLWVWRLEGCWKAPGTGRQVHGWGLRRDLGVRGGVEGPWGPCHSRARTPRCTKRQLPCPSARLGLSIAIKDHRSSFLNHTAAKNAPAPYNHSITVTMCYDLTTLPAHYRMRKQRNCFNCA